jgi:hypothetical protein
MELLLDLMCFTRATPESTLPDRPFFGPKVLGRTPFCYHGGDLLIALHLYILKRKF